MKLKDHEVDIFTNIIKNIAVMKDISFVDAFGVAMVKLGYR